MNFVPTARNFIINGRILPWILKCSICSQNCGLNYEISRRTWACFLNGTIHSRFVLNVNVLNVALRLIISVVKWSGIGWVGSACPGSSSLIGDISVCPCRGIASSRLRVSQSSAAILVCVICCCENALLNIVPRCVNLFFYCLIIQASRFCHHKSHGR